MPLKFLDEFLKFLDDLKFLDEFLKFLDEFLKCFDKFLKVLTRVNKDLRQNPEACLVQCGSGTEHRAGICAVYSSRGPHSLAFLLCQGCQLL